eukprot:3018885-Rhodomonas_salina.4
MKPHLGAATWCQSWPPRSGLHCSKASCLHRPGRRMIAHVSTGPGIAGYRTWRRKAYLLSICSSHPSASLSMLILLFPISNSSFPRTCPRSKPSVSAAHLKPDTQRTADPSSVPSVCELGLCASTRSKA